MTNAGCGLRRKARAFGEFFAGEIAETQQQIVHAIERPRFVCFRCMLQLFFGFFDGVDVEQFAQIGIAEQLAQLVLIDAQRLCAALG